MSEKLGKFRQEIDDIDERIVGLLGARFALTRQVGVVKLAEKLPMTDMSREHDMLARVNELADAAEVPQHLAAGVLSMVIDEVVKEHTVTQEMSRSEGLMMGERPSDEFNWLG